MKNIQKLSLVVLAVLIFSSACGTTSKSDQIISGEGMETSSSEENAQETTAGVFSFLPDGYNLKGQKITILYGQNVMNDVGVENEVTYGINDFEQGDIIAEAVYNRTKLAEEKLNCEIVSPMVMQW